MEKVYENIKKLRIERGLSQEELAKEPDTLTGRLLQRLRAAR